MSSPVQGSDQGAVQSSAQDPVHNDADTQQASLADLKHVSETHRLQHEVVEAAQRLESEAAENAFQLMPNNTVSFRIPVVRRAVERPSREEANERVWSALRSEFLAPPQRGWGVPGIAMVAGSIGAVILAAAVALLVVNLVQIPAPSVAASGEDEAARTESFSSAAVNLSKIATAQAKMQPADDEPQPAPPATTPPAPALATTPAPAPSTVVLAIAGPVSDIAPAKSPEPLPSPSPEIKPAAIETAPPSPPVPPSSSAAAPAPPASASPAAASPPPVAPPASPSPAAVPESQATVALSQPQPTVTSSQPRPTVTLSQDEITSLMQRSRALIAAGDVASARLVLTHLADAGVAEASFVLACTFYSSVLENLRVVGVRPDPAKALAWYSRAAEQGSPEAKQHLQALR